MRGLKGILWTAAGILASFALSAGVSASALPASVTIPVQQEFEDESGGEADGTFRYILKSENGEAPMPGGKTGETFSFSVTGTQKLELKNMNFTQPGTYRYLVSQTVPADTGNYEYDKSRYTVEVLVKSVTEQTLRAQMFVFNEDGEKCGVLSFKTAYRTEDDGSGTSTGGGYGGGSSSAGVKYSGSSGAKPVKTSDPSDVTLWTGMLAGSALLLSLMAALKRKSK